MSSIPLLETPRLLLKAFESSDTKALFEIVGDPKVMEFWAQGPARTFSQTAIFLQKAIQHWKQHGCGDWALIEKKENTLIGFCGLEYMLHWKEVTIGYAIKRSKWRLGFATEAIQATLDFAFHTLQLEEVIALVDPSNTPSLELLKTFHFIYWKEGSHLNKPCLIYKLTRLYS